MREGSHAAGQEQLPDIDTTVPHSARFWDFLLGARTTTRSTARSVRRSS